MVVTTTVLLRRGTVEDAVALAELAARTFAETFAADNRPEDLQAHLEKSYGVAQQSEELLDPDVVTVLADQGAELVAFAQVRRNAPPPCVAERGAIELNRFYLVRRMHGTGLATRLMHASREAALALGGRHLWLGVWERNPRAQAFYRKAGFTDVGSTFYMVGPDRQTDRVFLAEVASP
jgi:GNAT superfamily N-acetyltransferase